MKTTQGQQIYTGGRCEFNQEIRRCLSRHRFSLQSADVHKFLKVEDVNLTTKSGGVFMETNLLYNQQRWTNCVQLEDVTLPVQSRGVLKHKFAFQ